MAASPLVVPVDFEALCSNGTQGPGTCGYMPGLTSFENLPYGNGSPQTPFISEYVLQQPFNGGQATTEAGVHLHWAMPDALMHGAGQSGAMRFPALPDRWLLVRLSLTPTGAAGPSRSWVVDSGYLDDSIDATKGNIGSSAVPWQPANDPTLQNPHFKFLGRTVPLAAWTGPDPGASYLDRLTAISFAKPELAAYYPNTRNVFGAHDPLDDLAGSSGAAGPLRLCYVVVGWHSRPSDDPLASGTPPDALAALRWHVDAPGPFAGTIYCGVVHSVRFDPTTAAPTPPQPLTVAIGNTTSEALSALIVAGAGTMAQAPGPLSPEWALDALLAGLLDAVTDPAGQRRVARQLHRHRFKAIAGGDHWYVTRAAGGGDCSADLALAQAQALADLNRKQEALNRRRNELRDLQWRVFADWYKYLCVMYPPQPFTTDPDQIRKLMTGSSLADVATAESDVTALESAVTSASNALTPRLDTGLSLARKPGPHYWRPRDPVLLLHGADVRPTWRYGGDGRHSDDGTLLCRASGSLVAGLRVPAGAMPGVTSAFALGAADAASLWPGPGASLLSPNIAAVVTSLIREAALLWPDWAAPVLAAKSPRAAAPAIAAYLADAGKREAAAEPGTLPSPVGLKAWSGNPWLPIMIHWELSYRPLQPIVGGADGTSDTGPPLDATLIVSRLRNDNPFDENEVDIVLQNEAANAAESPFTYSGTTFLTPHVGSDMERRLADYARRLPNSPLARLAVGTMPLLSQALAGFYDRFLMRRQTLQLGVGDPFAASEDQPFIASVQGATQGQAAADGSTVAPLAVEATAPMPHDAFSPVVAGSLDLVRLWIVDAFGQYKTYDFDDVAHQLIAARSLQSRAPGASAPAFLPPRLAQPARLLVRWIAAATDQIEATDLPGASPICGWMVPNYLDRTLAIYGADGAALGSIAVIDGALAFFGSPANPSTFALAATKDETAKLLQGHNAHLAAFVMAMLNKSATSYLDDFIDTLEDAAEFAQPLRHTSSAQPATLSGSALALVRAAVQLELMGSPAVNESWGALQYDMNRSDGTRTTNGYEAVRLPVMLGNLMDPDDGLFGFFIEGAGDPYVTFYSVAEETGRAGITPRRAQTLTVTGDAAQPLVVTMVIDPRSQIHVTSGYVPATTLEIPPEMFGDAEARMQVTFMAAPVLTTTAPGDLLSLPLPSDGGQRRAWNWSRIQAGAPPQAQTLALQPPKGDTAFATPSVYLQEGWLSTAVNDTAATPESGGSR